jgi:hypothetical protein
MFDNKTDINVLASSELDFIALHGVILIVGPGKLELVDDVLLYLAYI